MSSCGGQHLIGNPYGRAFVWNGVEVVRVYVAFPQLFPAIEPLAADEHRGFTRVTADERGLLARTFLSRRAIDFESRLGRVRAFAQEDDRARLDLAEGARQRLERMLDGARIFVARFAAHAVRVHDQRPGGIDLWHHVIAGWIL